MPTSAGIHNDLIRFTFNPKYVFQNYILYTYFREINQELSKKSEQFTYEST